VIVGEFTVSHAIVTALLERAQVPQELLDHLGKYLAFCERQD
jgi:hypothetical protein